MVESIKWFSVPVSLDGLRFTLAYANGLLENPHFDSHIHSGIEFYINVSGNVSFFVDDRLYPVESGDVIVSPSNVVHHCVGHGVSVHEHYCLWIDADETSPLFAFLKDADFSPRIVFEPAVKETMLTLLSEFRSLGEAESDKLQTLKTAYLLQFLSLFIIGKKVTVDDTGDTPAVFQEILKYYDEHVSTIHSIESVAERFFISPATLNRYFKKYLHLSPKEFLEAKKISVAKILLTQGSSVHDASEEAGFFDSSHFIAAFKKKFGITPLQYKRSISK